MATRYTFLVCLFLFSGFIAFAQEEEADVPDYQMLYADPYETRNIYLQFQPFYGNIGTLNVSGGYDVEARIKPGIKKRSFFLVFKISFPIYAKMLGLKENSVLEPEN